MTESAAPIDANDAEIAAFWADARIHANLNRLAVYMGSTPLDTLPPPAWSFGGTPEEADTLLALVLAGTKTATASALWDYEPDGAGVPTPGQLSIVLDAQRHPRALISTTRVDVMPFDEVPADFAYAEGEGDRSPDHWRRVHREFFTTYAADGQEFRSDLAVVCEHFRVLYQR